MKAAGRWSLLAAPAAEREQELSDDRLEAAAWTLLRRYGVVFRKLLARERTPPWRDLLRVYRRMEARGELRGGRFVDGFSGEQYALPEAVPALRRVRRQAPDGRWLSLGAADPLCLVGVLTPGPRLPASGSNRVLWRDGVPVAVQEAGETRFLEEIAAEQRWEAHATLLRRNIPSTLRAYLERAS